HALEEGDPVFIGPKGAGFFTLSMVPEADTLWMLSTGTALGPFLSMLKTDEPWDRFENIVLVHAVRHAKELTYQNQIKRFLGHDADKFQYIPFVSREETDFALPGRVPAAIESGALQQRASLPMTTQESQIMICGNPAMVRDTHMLLETQGFAPNTRRSRGHITMETYWEQPLAELTAVGNWSQVLLDLACLVDTITGCRHTRADLDFQHGLIARVGNGVANANASAPPVRIAVAITDRCDRTAVAGQ